MKNIVILITAILLSSCSAKWHLKKAVKKDPSILKQNVVQFDTVIVTEPKYLTDTVVLNEIDSIVIEKDKIITKLWRTHDTIRVETICPPDTIFITKEVICPPSVIYKKSILDYIPWGLVVLLLFGSIIFFIYFRK